MGLIWAVVLGWICGALARVLLPGEHKMDLLATLLLGIVGCFAARIVGAMLGVYSLGEGVGLIGGVLGSMAALWGYEQYTVQKPDYAKEVAGKFNQVVSQFKTAAKNTVSSVEDVAFKEKPQTTSAASATGEPPTAPQA